MVAGTRIGLYGWTLLVSTLLWLAPLGLAGATDTQALTLDDALKLAAANNPDLKEIDEVVLRAEVGIQRAWSVLLPNLGANAAITRNDSEVKLPSDGDLAALDAGCTAGDQALCDELAATRQIVIQERWMRSAGLTASMTLLSPRSIPLIINGHASYQTARRQARHARAELFYAVAAAYYAVVQAEKLTAVAEKGLERADEYLKLAQNRFKVGAGIEVDVLRAKMERADAEKVRIQAHTGYQLAQQALGFLIGVTPPLVLTPPAAPALPEAQKKDWVKQAVETREDLRAAEQTIAIAERSELEAWLGFLPNTYVQGSYDWTSASGFSGDETSWRVMFVAEWPLFEGSRKIADIRERRSRIRSARLASRRLRDQIANEVREAWLKREDAHSQLLASRTKAELAKENYRLIKRQYGVGLADNLSMLDASTALLQAEQSLAVDELSEKLSVLTLRQRLGLYLQVEANDER